MTLSRYVFTLPILSIYAMEFFSWEHHSLLCHDIYSFLNTLKLVEIYPTNRGSRTFGLNSTVRRVSLMMLYLASARIEVAQVQSRERAMSSVSRMRCVLISQQGGTLSPWVAILRCWWLNIARFFSAWKSFKPLFRTVVVEFWDLLSPFEIGAFSYFLWPVPRIFSELFMNFFNHFAPRPIVFGAWLVDIGRSLSLFQNSVFVLNRHPLLSVPIFLSPVGSFILINLGDSLEF